MVKIITSFFHSPPKNKSKTTVFLRLINKMLILHCGGWLIQNHVVQDNDDDNHDEDDDNTDEDNSLTSNTDVSYGC